MTWVHRAKVWPLERMESFKDWSSRTAYRGAKWLAQVLASGGLPRWLYVVAVVLAAAFAYGVHESFQSIPHIQRVGWAGWLPLLGFLFAGFAALLGWRRSTWAAVGAAVTLLFGVMLPVVPSGVFLWVYAIIAGLALLVLLQLTQPMMLGPDTRAMLALNAFVDEYEQVRGQVVAMEAAAISVSQAIEATTVTYAERSEAVDLARADKESPVRDDGSQPLTLSPDFWPVVGVLALVVLLAVLLWWTHPSGSGGGGSSGGGGTGVGA